MSFVYTNRKGIAYYLCQGVTASGKQRYYLARKSKGEPVEEIPEGYIIIENVNGVARLVKERAEQVLPAEVDAVTSAVKKYLDSDRYRVEVEQDRIVVYERVGIGAEELTGLLGRLGLFGSEQLERTQEFIASQLRYTPVWHFDLVDGEQRLFAVRRRGEQGWVKMKTKETLEKLLRGLVLRP